MNQPVKLKPVKGYPMLDWVGKKAPDIAVPFPAQPVEAFGIAHPPPSPTWKVLEKNWCNLLFHGDNMEILATLLVDGFRGKVDLIYIDPPFDSGVDYVRKVILRGPKKHVLQGEEGSLLEKKQYEDIWKDDTYLQYMYERLILLRELLSEQGSIYLHCDWHKSHHLRFLMDEVFGEENFVNEIIWCYVGAGRTEKCFNRKHDTILFYRKVKDNVLFNWKEVSVPYEDLPITGQWRKGHTTREEAVERATEKMKDGKMRYDWWRDIPAYATATRSPERTDFPTQKPEGLLERIIEASSNEGSLVLDCFCGSGTTAAVAERLSRRWIACDMNRGAIQTTVSRLLKNNGGKDTRPFAQYRVNNYDFGDQDETKKHIKKTYGVENIPSDLYFDGTSKGRLVKIAPLNRALSAKDIEDIKATLRDRPDEDRDILLVGNGCENSVYEKMEEHNRFATINIVTIQDAQKDHFHKATPSRAVVDVQEQDGRAIVTIQDFVSPTILCQLKKDRSEFQEDIGDFRAQIDRVFIDNDYDSKTFRIVESDIPEKKSDFVKATYSVTRPHAKAVVAVKIIDMLGEEILILHPSKKLS